MNEFEHLTIVFLLPLISAALRKDLLVKIYAKDGIHYLQLNVKYEKMTKIHHLKIFQSTPKENIEWLKFHYKIGQSYSSTVVLSKAEQSYLEVISINYTMNYFAMQSVSCIWNKWRNIMWV